MRILLWERAGFLLSLRPGTLLSSQQWKWPVLIRGAGEAKLRSLRVPVQSWAGQAQQDKERRCSVINPEHGSVTHIQSSTAQFHPLETSQLWVPQALVETSHCCVSLSSPEQSCSELQPPWQGALQSCPVFPGTSTQPTAKPLLWAWPEAGTAWPVPTVPSTAGLQHPGHSRVLHCPTGWLVAPWGSLHSASGMGSLQQRGLGAVQPKGNQLQMPSWALCTAAHSSRDAAKPLTSPPPVLAFLSHPLSSHTASCPLPGVPVLSPTEAAAGPCLGWTQTPGAHREGAVFLPSALPALPVPCHSHPQGSRETQLPPGSSTNPFPPLARLRQLLPSSRRGTAPHSPILRGSAPQLWPKLSHHGQDVSLPHTQLSRAEAGAPISDSEIQSPAPGEGFCCHTVDVVLLTHSI